MTDTADPLALEEQVCFALSVAARGVVAVYRPLLEPMGLTHPQYLVMLALWQRACCSSTPAPCPRCSNGWSQPVTCAANVTPPTSAASR
jgi:hypothetical protein